MGIFVTVKYEHNLHSNIHILRIHWKCDVKSGHFSCCPRTTACTNSIHLFIVGMLIDRSMKVIINMQTNQLLLFNTFITRLIHISFQDLSGVKFNSNSNCTCSQHVQCIPYVQMRFYSNYSSI